MSMSFSCNEQQPQKSESSDETEAPALDSPKPASLKEKNAFLQQTQCSPLLQPSAPQSPMPQHEVVPSSDSPLEPPPVILKHATLLPRQTGEQTVNMNRYAARNRPAAATLVPDLSRFRQSSFIYPQRVPVPTSNPEIKYGGRITKRTIKREREFTWIAPNGMTYSRKETYEVEKSYPESPSRPFSTQATMPIYDASWPIRNQQQNYSEQQSFYSWSYGNGSPSTPAPFNVNLEDDSQVGPSDLLPETTQALTRISDLGPTSAGSEQQSNHATCIDWLLPSFFDPITNTSSSTSFSTSSGHAQRWLPVSNVWLPSTSSNNIQMNLPTTTASEPSSFDMEGDQSSPQPDDNQHL